jgi:hypothetical protein
MAHHRKLLFVLAILLFAIPRTHAQSAPPNSSSTTPLSELLSAIRAKSKSLESAPAMRQGFQSFLAAHHLDASAVRYSDYVLVHLLFEATRDAGFWGMHWSITDQPPNSDQIWRQWKSVTSPSFTRQTATAECDELSALFAFLVVRSGVKSVGLFWPYPNHTVAVWTIHPIGSASAKPIRVVIPTSQIFLTDADTFDTHGFDPWQQKNIYDYTRRDAPDSFALPRPLFDFFLAETDKYAGASESALQQLRNLRGAVFNHELTPAQAAAEARRRRAAFSTTPEDSGAFQHFADDLAGSNN